LIAPGLPLEGRVAVVTGSRRGIGFAVANVLAREGAAVLVCGVSDALGVERSALLLRDRHAARAASFAGDLTVDGVAEDLVRTAERDLGPVDVLVNNAGGFVMAHTTLETDRTDWERMISVNLTAPFLLTQRCLPGMLARGWGRIINVASEVALAPMLGNAVAYTAAKAGLIGFTKQLALEVAGTGVTANVINPGTIATEHLHEAIGEAGIDRERLLRSIPAGRFGTPEEVAGIVPYLVSDSGSFTTGAVFEVNGGRAMH
jgi:NAD(P)-dependent dehydrogenase (short-subunit alcohol dehydrogenase family)